MLYECCILIKTGKVMAFTVIDVNKCNNKIYTNY